MNFEKSILPKNGPILPEHLLDACERFSEILANNDWLDPGTREVSLSRSFTEVLGHTSRIAFGGEPIQQVKMRTTVSFEGEKEVMREDEDGEELLEEFYTVSAKLSEAIHNSRVPQHILEKFAHSTVAMEDIDDEEYNDLAAEAIPGSPELTPSVLQVHLFEHEHEIRYVIDNNGDLDNYIFTVRYKADNKVIGESSYAWNGEGQNGFIPTAFADKKVLEWGPDDQVEFEEADVAEFLCNFEKIIQTVVDGEAFNALQEEMCGDEDDHTRRALGIIALTAANFKHFKI